MGKPQRQRAYFLVRAVGFKRFRGNLEGEHVYTREEVFRNLSFEEAKRLVELLMAEMYRELSEEIPSVQGFAVTVKPILEPDELDSFTAELPFETNNEAGKPKTEKAMFHKFLQLQHLARSFFFKSEAFASSSSVLGKSLPLSAAYTETVAMYAMLLPKHLKSP